MAINIKKHINQIKNGGLIVIIKKLRTTFYLLTQAPFYLFSILLLVLIYLIRPWLLIRWYGLTCSRIGHFALDTELYFCRRDAKINQPSQKYIDIFFLGNKYVCNKQLLKMFRRKLTILPAFFMTPLFNVNRFVKLFIKKCNQHEININSAIDRDLHDVLHRSNPHISFNEEEKLKGKKILSEFGVPEGSKIVCLIVRDSAYLDRYKDLTLRDFSYHNHRDGDIDRYILAAEELVKRGYYVFRMGMKVIKPLKSTNPKIIDYANSKKRSDFMDIYLGANCTFCISTALGFDAVPQVFRKPIAYIYMPFGHMRVEIEKDLLIAKHHFSKKDKKKLTISEIFENNVAFSHYADEYEKNNIEYQENTPEEIKDLVTEMDERISGTWKETEEDQLLQKKFWSIFEKNIKKLNLQNSMYGIKKKSKFSANFLRNNLDWIQ
ncbi:TIGR04372 family glycosyltransferase [Candidatus Pelagibacter sp.]|nr:TIGR04372 family glycosyltransferase [Candidatus Pelagibacter sp.]